MSASASAGDRRASVAEVVRSLAFYAVFYGGTLPYLLTALIALPLGERRFRMVARAWSGFHRACLRLLGIRVEVTGPAPPPGALLAIKHQSFLEALDLPVLFRSPAVIAKASLLRIPLWGRLARAYGLIPVERDQGAKALRAMLAAARAEADQGRLLVIFPEGTRVPIGQAPPLQSGFAALYKLLALAVVPVGVDSGRLYHRRWKRAGTIHVRIGAPIAPGLPREEIEARVHAAINALSAAP